MSKKRSFFERITGTIKMDDQFPEEDFNDAVVERPIYEEEQDEHATHGEPEDEVGELPVDVFHTRDSIVVKTITAGVRKNDLDISLTRESISISGQRNPQAGINSEDYFHQELYWGRFERFIELPEEVDIDMAEAKEEHGLLTIKLPKVDRNRRTQIKVV